MAILDYIQDGYITLLAYIFVIFLEYLVFMLIFKHEEDKEHGDIVKLRYGNPDDQWVKAKVVIINLAIVLILIPFVLVPLKSIIKLFVAQSGYYLIPITFLAGALGYLAAMKEHISHKWETEDTVILATGIGLFIISIVMIIYNGL